MVGIAKTEHTQEELDAIKSISDTGTNFALLIIRLCEDGPEKDRSLRNVGIAMKEAQTSLAITRGVSRANAVKLGPMQIQLDDGTWVDWTSIDQLKL